MSVQSHGLDGSKPERAPDAAAIDATAPDDVTQLIRDPFKPKAIRHAGAPPVPDGNSTPEVALGLTIEYLPPDQLQPSKTEQSITLTTLAKIEVGAQTTEPETLPIAPASVRHLVPGYEILRELGRGGMGVVYQARQKGLNRLVALKMILAGDHADGKQRERFRLEAESVAALQHPNIVQIFEIGEVDDRAYLAFEYIEGGTLAAHLAGNPWSSVSAAALVENLARAIQFAHDRGIVHRDLKPGNIMLVDGASPWENDDKKGAAHKDSSPPRMPSASFPPVNRRISIPIPKITDFGLAKRVERDSEISSSDDAERDSTGDHTRTGAVMGTPSYIAPEQAAGKNRDVGPPADVYSLGAILYELLTGRPPFRGETPLDTVLQVMSDDPISPRVLQPKVPRDLETICMKCLQKLPTRRYESAGALADDLRRFLNHEPIEARPIGSSERLVKWAKRHPSTATSLFVSLLALITMLGISFYYNFALQKSAEEKEFEASKAREAQLAAEKSAREKDEQTRYANEQKKKADDRLKEVEKAQKIAEINHQDALRREDKARRAAYALALNRANALAERDPYRAALLLSKRDECPPELHDFTWRYLRGVCRVDDPHVLEGHAKTITRTAWSPDGTRLATSSWDGTARIWDAHTFQALAVLHGHHGYVRSIAFAPDGFTLVTAGTDHRVHFWELPPWLSPANVGEPVKLEPWATMDAGDVRTVTISPDGKRVAAGNNDGKILLFGLPMMPRNELAAIGGGAGSLVARSPEGGQPLDAGAIVSLPEKPIPEEVLSGHNGTVTSVVWRNDGLYSGGQDHHVRRWRLGKTLESEIVYNNSDSVRSIAVSDDGELMAVAGSSSDNNSIKLWNLRQSREIARLRGHIRTVYSVAFSRDGKHLASGSDDGTVRLWETSSGQETSVYRGHKEPVLSVVFSPDGRFLASAGHGRVVRLWNLNNPHEQSLEISFQAPLPPASQPVAALSADGHRLAVVDRDNSIRIWSRTGDHDFGRFSNWALRGIGGTIGCFTIAPDGGMLAAASNLPEEGIITVWTLPQDGAKGPLELKSPRSFRETGEVHGLALYGRLLAVAGKDGVKLWNLDTRKLIVKPLRQSANSVAFTPDGTKLISALDHSLHVWDLATGKEEHRISTLDNQELTSITVGPALEERPADLHAPRWPIATCDRNGGAKIWMLAPAKSVNKGQRDNGGRPMQLEYVTFLAGHAEPITSVAFTTDGNTIATSSEDRTVRLWDSITGRERSALTTHTDSVLLTAFLDNDSTLLGLGRDGSLKLWHASK